MKKINIILLFMASMTIFLFTGCSDTETFIAQNYLSSETEISSVTIDVLDREVEVRASSDNQIHIDYYESKKEYYDISVSEDNVLTMKYLDDKNWLDYIGKKSPKEYRKIILYVPSNLLDDLDIKTTNENVVIFDVSVSNSISLDVNGGNIKLEKINVGKSINLIVKNGNITGTIMGSYDLFSISCTIKKGNCNLPLDKNGGEKQFMANCNNGDIEIEFTNGQ